MFAEEDEAPMPAVAAAAGVGIGSLYRCYEAKEDLVAAIVVESVEEIRGQIVEAREESENSHTGAIGDTLNQMVNDLFRVLAHPIRRGIVEKLAVGPATVGDATGGFGVSKPAITKHLRVLEESGVVSRVKVGRTQRLSLEPAALSDATEWIDRQRALWERRFDAVDDHLKQTKETM